MSKKKPMKLRTRHLPEKVQSNKQKSKKRTLDILYEEFLKTESYKEREISEDCNPPYDPPTEEHNKWENDPRFKGFVKKKNGGIIK